MKDIYLKFTVDKLKKDLKKLVFEDYGSLKEVVVIAEDEYEMADATRFIIDFENDEYDIIKITNVFIPPNLKNVTNIYVAIGGIHKIDEVVDYIPKKCFVILSYDLIGNAEIPFSYEFGYISLSNNFE